MRWVIICKEKNGKELVQVNKKYCLSLTLVKSVVLIQAIGIKFKLNKSYEENYFSGS